MTQRRSFEGAVKNFTLPPSLILTFSSSPYLSADSLLLRSLRFRSYTCTRRLSVSTLSTYKHVYSSSDGRLPRPPEHPLGLGIPVDAFPVGSFRSPNQEPLSGGANRGQFQVQPIAPLLQIVRVTSLLGRRKVRCARIRLSNSIVSGIEPTTFQAPPYVCYGKTRAPPTELPPLPDGLHHNRGPVLDINM
jgi:hypothetical protein